jgi:hypothetical protein
MWSDKVKVTICDIASQVDTETGDRIKVFQTQKTVICDKLLVGVVTQQLAQTQSMTFSFALDIDKMYYNEQKYVYLKSKLYEVKNVTTGTRLQNCKLLVSENDDKDIKPQLRNG